MSWRSMGRDCLIEFSNIGRSLEWTSSSNDSVVNCRNLAEWISMLAVFLCRCQFSSSALDIPLPRRSWTVSRKNGPLGKLENLILRRCSRLRGSEVIMPLTLLNEGPLNLNVPFWLLRMSLAHSYILPRRPPTKDGNIPRTGQIGSPWCFFCLREWNAMKTKRAMKSSVIGICCKSRSCRETRFPVASSSSEEERLIGLIMVLGWLEMWDCMGLVSLRGLVVTCYIYIGVMILVFLGMHVITKRYDLVTN